MALPSTSMIQPPQIGGSSSTVGSGAQAKEPYDITPTNWYKSLPYGFAFWDINSNSSDKAKSTIWLPISPNNISVTTNFATNVITTLYGIIEEHSEVRYYDILIQGTTGFAPRFVSAFQEGAKLADFQSNGRSAFTAKGLDLGGFLPEVTNTINQALNVVNEVGDALNGGPKNSTGIDPNKSGYVAFHNLYRSFLKYKNDAAQIDSGGGDPGSISSSLAGAAASALASGGTVSISKPARKIHPIQFLNYKDGIKYDCVPLSFTLVRSADNPMLYNYSLRLKAFNLRNVNATVPEGDQLAKLGLGGLDGQSLFSTMTSIAGNAANVVSSLF